MGGFSNDQKDAFQARLERINGVVEEEKAAKEAAKPKRFSFGGKRDVRASANGQPVKHKDKRKIPIGLFIAFFIAAISLLFGNVVDHTLSTYSGPNAHLVRVVPAIGPFGVTAVILVIVMVGLGMRDKPHLIGVPLGLLAMWAGEPYLAYLNEPIWIQLYDADHVDAMLVQAGLRTPILALQ